MTKIITLSLRKGCDYLLDEIDEMAMYCRLSRSEMILRATNEYINISKERGWVIKNGEKIPYPPTLNPQAQIKPQ